MVMLIKEICVFARSPSVVTYRGFTDPVEEVKDLTVSGLNERPCVAVTCANHAFLLAVGACRLVCGTYCTLSYLT